MVMTTMTVVHEIMHQRAGQQQQERQRTEEVGAVLSQQEIARDGPDNNQADRVAGTPKTGRSLMRPMVMIHVDDSFT